MTKRTCGMPGCSKPHLAQDRCAAHYHEGRRLGEIGILNTPRHEISDLDRQAKAGTCAICGPVDVYWSEKKPDPRCGVKVRADGKRKRARSKTSEKWPKLLEYHRNYARRRKFRLPKDGIERLLKRVDYRCEICGDQLSLETARIDHDHACCDDPAVPTCGLCIRGVLCNTCNTGIGMMKDDAQRLAAAAKYLDERTGLTFGRIA